MSSLASIRREKQYNKNNPNDENTSDDSLLLMADDVEQKAPLLNISDDDLVRGEPILLNDIPCRSRSSTSHCHVPDEKFDYGARNRLIIVLILCIIFMVIEIIGMCFCVEFNKEVAFIYIGGVISNSTAVVTDAAHMCIDSTSFLISLAAIYLGRKRPTQQLSFGYIRAGLISIFFFQVYIC
jgi:hypothetical protein